MACSDSESESISSESPQSTPSVLHSKSKSRTTTKMKDSREQDDEAKLANVAADYFKRGQAKGRAFEAQLLANKGLKGNMVHDLSELLLVDCMTQFDDSG
jgi:hypothetical protein